MFQMVKKSSGNGGDAGLISGLGRSPGEGNSNSLQCSCLGNTTDREGWWATVHGVAKESDTTEQLILPLSNAGKEREEFALVILGSQIFFDP